MIVSPLAWGGGKGEGNFRVKKSHQLIYYLFCSKEGKERKDQKKPPPKKNTTTTGGQVGKKGGKRSCSLRGIKSLNHVERERAFTCALCIRKFVIEDGEM